MLMGINAVYQNVRTSKSRAQMASIDKGSPRAMTIQITTFNANGMCGIMDSPAVSIDPV